MNLNKYTMPTVILIICFMIAGFGYYKLFYISEEARQFLNITSTKLKEGEPLLMSEVTSFKWDKVCLNRSDSMGDFVGEETTSNNKEKKEISKKPVILVFFSEGSLTKVFHYNGWEKISLLNKRYRFLARAEKYVCFPEQQAVLLAKTTETGCCGTSSEIILTKKDN